MLHDSTSILMSQSMQWLVEKVGMENYKATKTLVNMNEKLCLDDGDGRVNEKQYRMFLSNTRLDIAYNVNPI